MGGLRVTTAGESHGPAEVCIVEGMPAGLALSSADIDIDLARRQSGYGRGGRMAIERDRCRFAGGVRHGRTLGSPICIIVENVDHSNWSTVMSPEPILEQPSMEQASRGVTVPRPGHADLAGLEKYDFDDVRNVLERASARETVGRVAAGAVCKRLLSEVGVNVRARVISIERVGVSEAGGLDDPRLIDWQAVEQSPVGCESAEASNAMCASIDRARDAGESLGGVFEVWCWGLCPGVGGYATMESRLDGRLLGALASIPAIKGVEIGLAFGNAALRGSEVHDEIHLDSEGFITRATNRSAGVEGGMSTGMPIVIRAAMKPIPTLTTPLESVDLATMEATRAHVERSDVTAVPAARVVGEAMAACVLASCYLEKFGGDSLADFRDAVHRYEARLGERGLWRRS